ncbi:type I DNA topoisomerase [bacterium]|nr:MAG: type I DNA topoisomerase [bacterium]
MPEKKIKKKKTVLPKSVKAKAKAEAEEPIAADSKAPSKYSKGKRGGFKKTKTVKDHIEIEIDKNIKRGSKSLVIVESPSKAKTINKYLGSNFVVEASIGHIKNLPSTKLGIDVENGYTPEYRIIDGKQDVIRKLKTMAASTQEVFIATDPDREGEAIAWHIAGEIDKNNPKISRVLFNEITKSGIAEAMAHPLKIDDKLVKAQQARRVLDRIVGYKVSPFLWTVIRRGTSAGRVQSVALQLVCKREAEIEAFITQEYWSIHSKLQARDSDPFKASLHFVDGKKPVIDRDEVARGYVEDIRKKEFIIKDIRRRETKRNASAPFTTSSLQQEASRKNSFSPKMTMMIAQQLYEGVELGEEGLTGLITYMRTDSTRVADSAVASLREFIYASFGKEFLPPGPNEFKNKKANMQDAHEAIRPTNVAYTPKLIAKYLTPQQLKLYELVWNRFVASQMMPAIMDQTTIDITADEYLFRATGSIMKFRGFLQVYEEGRDEGDKKDDNGDDDEVNALLPPDLKINDKLNLMELLPEQHFTKPPARFTESSLIKELDTLGIGRPSTYAMIVSTIVDREYAEIKERKLFATELGKSVNHILSNYFSELFNIKFTAEMEEELDKIEEGELSYKKVLDDFYRAFAKNMKEVESKKAEVKESMQEKTDEVCELCSKPMIIKWGRYGKFMACSGYPDCKNIKKLAKDGEAPPEPEMTDEKCPKCESPMVIKIGKYGKFMACSNYPTCKTTKPILDIVPDIICPKDGGQIVRRKSRFGKFFYGCANYPNCDFILWNEPVNERCPHCDAAYMVKKITKRKGDYLLCMTCNHEEPIKIDTSALKLEEQNGEPVNFTDEENT